MVRVTYNYAYFSPGLTKQPTFPYCVRKKRDQQLCKLRADNRNHRDGTPQSNGYPQEPVKRGRVHLGAHPDPPLVKPASTQSPSRAPPPDSIDWSLDTSPRNEEIISAELSVKS